MDKQQIDWGGIRLVIFDVDGTLYFQGQLRKKMLAKLVRYFFANPLRLRELLIIYYFRKLREQNTSTKAESLHEAQYKWVSKKLNLQVGTVRNVIEKWMLKEPIALLPECKIPDIGAFISRLRSKDIKVAFYSDYPAQQKLLAMKLTGDMIVSSVDPKVNRLKPDPTGVNLIMQRLNTDIGSTLVIGDRDDRDGEAARRAGVNYIILPHRKKEFFTDLMQSL